MATFYQYLFNSQPHNPDPSRSSLDDLKQADAIPIVMKTWKELMKNKKEVGSKIYEYVLTKEISMSRLFMNSRIDQQSELFMAMLDRVVNYLDEPQTIDARLQELGEMHAGRFGVKTRHFKHFRTAFMRAIKVYIPWNDRREHAWMWFWNRVINVMSAAAQTNSMLLPQNLTQDAFIEYAALVHATFDHAMQYNPHTFASNFYKKLLADQPDIAELFADTTFDKQAAKFITMMQHAIKLLDDYQSFHRKLIKLSIQHKAYNVKVEQLQAFGDVLIMALKEVNHKNWTKKHDAAWEWYWKMIVDLFSRGLRSNAQVARSHPTIRITDPVREDIVRAVGMNANEPSQNGHANSDNNINGNNNTDNNQTSASNAATTTDDNEEQKHPN